MADSKTEGGTPHPPDLSIYPYSGRMDGWIDTWMDGRTSASSVLPSARASANMARPAFSNAVEYDLSASTLIGYQDAQLEIVEATNTSITYRVLRNFNTATP